MSNESKSLFTGLSYTGCDSMLDPSPICSPLWTEAAKSSVAPSKVDGVSDEYDRVSTLPYAKI
jgi:hypothetical protein